MLAFCLIIVFCDMLSMVGLVIGILYSIWKTKKRFVFPLIVFILSLLLTIIFRDQIAATYQAIFGGMGPIPEEVLLKMP